MICDKIRGLFHRGKNSKDVELWLGKFADDERWMQYFTAPQQIALLKFFEAWLTIAGDDDNMEGGIEDEYYRLRKMLDTAESFDPDDR